MDYLDRAYLTRLTADLIGEGETVINFARGYGTTPKPTCLIVAFTGRQAVLARYKWDFDRKKVDSVAAGKFENKAKWIKRAVMIFRLTFRGNGGR